MTSRYELAPRPNRREIFFRRGREQLLNETLGLHEKCAVFGIFLPNGQASPLVYQGLLRQQHRGQDSTGIVSFENNQIFSHKQEGLVADVYTPQTLNSLRGSIAVGHNRYGTSGGVGHIQPVVSAEHTVALAHNGTLPRIKVLQRFLQKRNIDIVGLNDSELMQRAVQYYVTEKKLPLEDAVKSAYPLFTGAFSLVIAGEGKLIGLRDKCGIRPLSIGKIGDKGYAFSSETVGLDVVNAKFYDEVKPGEMVVINDKGVERKQIVKGTLKVDQFEFVYFSDKDSIIHGRKVEHARQGMGKQLAIEQKKLPKGKRVVADVVVPVPRSAISYAEGFAPEYGIPSVSGLEIREPGRTFIHFAGDRAERVRRKFKVNEELVRGKRVILLDDSIVRGTTARELVKMMRDAGAAEVHLFSGSSKVLSGDFYGIDLPKLYELIANLVKGEEGLKNYFGADSVRYPSIRRMVKGTGLSMRELCLSVFNGKYPIRIGKENRRSMRQTA